MSATQAILDYHARHNPFVHGHSALSLQNLELAGRAIAETVPRGARDTFIHGVARDAVAMATFVRRAIEPGASLLEAVFGQGGAEACQAGVLGRTVMGIGVVATLGASAAATLVGAALGAVVGHATGEGARHGAERLAARLARPTYDATSAAAAALFVAVSQVSGVCTLVPKAAGVTAGAAVGAVLGAPRSALEAAAALPLAD
jgi:hypothetical protein